MEKVTFNILEIYEYIYENRKEELQEVLSYIYFNHKNEHNEICKKIRNLLSVFEEI